MRVLILSAVCVTIGSVSGSFADERSPRLNPSIESDMLFEGAL